MDAQTVKLHPSVLLTPTWKGPYLASSLLNTPSPDGYLLPVSLRLLLRLCCLDNLCPLLCLHYDSGSLFSDKLLGEHTLTFNEGDVTYFPPLFIQTVALLGLFPTNITADAAFDAWYVYQTVVHHGGIAAIPLNQHGHPKYTRDADGAPLCPKNLPMYPTKKFHHTNGYRAQRYQCPLLFPEKTGQSCDHEQFAKGKGCVKDINIEKGGLMRVTIDRDHPVYKGIYCQRTSAERINSQAKALDIERPKVRNGRSVRNLNTLIYTVINTKALMRIRLINCSLIANIVRGASLIS